MTFTDKPDYWALLGISPGSNAQQLKTAFRREARKWHPDLNGNDVHAEERFKLVNEAYAVLSDTRKRKAWEESSLNSLDKDNFSEGFPSFDEYIDVVLGLRDRTTHNNINEPFREEVAEDLEATTAETNANSEWPTPSKKPPSPVSIYEDLESIVNLSPEEALYGSIVELETANGTLVEIQTPPCAGDGWRLRLSGVSLGGRDHFVQLRIQTEDGLRIDGLRVLYRLELLPHDAVLGCAIDIPTLSGPVTLQVPPNSSSGRLLRLRGRGLELDDRRGDQLVEIMVVIPPDISESEEALYIRLQELSLD